jgi:hypothetical protein
LGLGGCALVVAQGAGVVHLREAAPPSGQRELEPPKRSASGASA